MEDSLKKRYSIKLFSNIVSGIIGVILIGIIPKALGPIAFGQFMYLQDFFLKMITFFAMSTPMAFFTKLSARNMRKELITFYFFYALGLLLLLLIVVLLLYYTETLEYVLPNIPKKFVLSGLIFGFFTWTTTIFIKISDAYALTTSVELIRIGHKISSLFLLYYFIYSYTLDLRMYFYFLNISLLVYLCIITWLFIKKGILNKNTLNIRFGFKKISKEFIEYCSPLVIYTIMGVVVGLLDIWLLQKIAGSAETGFYGLAYSVVAICFLFTSAMTSIITREFSKYYHIKDFEQIKKLFYQYAPMLYSIAAFFGIFISIQSDNVILIFTDEKFKDAFMALIIMGFYPMHQTYGQFVGSLFYASGQTKLIRNISYITYPIGLLLSFLFIYIFELGAAGLAFKMIIGQLISISIQMYFIAKFLKVDLKYFFYHQLYAMIFFIVLAWISSNVIVIDSPLVKLLVSGIIYTILVILFTFMFPQVFATNRDEIKENLIRLKNVIKK